MKTGFFGRIALGNLSKNRRFFIPYILSGSGLLAAFFIIRTLACDQRLAQVKGGYILPQIMGLGSVVMALLTVIMLFYTNSFLMKQRSREYGLYQVLGMEKRHVARILFFETLFSTGIILVAGLVTGMLVYKLCSLLICKLLKVDSILGVYYLSSGGLLQASSLFLLIYLVCFLWNVFRLGRSRLVEQLKSQQMGEKEPGVRWILLVVGLVSLAAGYYIALTTLNPLQAMNYFFIAVILVIIGTYCLFITGTIAVLKLLKKNHRFYYRPKNMVAVSGLIYRMKQNAVGLASITILACGVLVMLSTSVSLYAGVKDSMKRMFPQDLYVEAAGYKEEGSIEKRVDFSEEIIREILDEFSSQYHMKVESLVGQTYLEVSYARKGEELVAYTDFTNRADMVSMVYITAQEYEKLTGHKLVLKENEMCLQKLNGGGNQLGGQVRIGNQTYILKEELEDFPVITTMSTALETYGMVLADQSALDTVFENQKTGYGEHASEYEHRTAICFDNYEEAAEAGTDSMAKLFSMLSDRLEALEYDSMILSIESIWEMEGDLLGIYGSLLFLGLLLGLVFLFATAMIIYYKQISEGYEDRSRFQIMTRIGMSGAEVRKTIGSQILLVFFLPLMVTAVHIAVAFPMITRVLRILYLNNIGLFLGCTCASFGVFAIIYVAIYILTARVYYRIVY